MYQILTEFLVRHSLCQTNIRNYLLRQYKVVFVFLRIFVRFGYFFLKESCSDWLPIFCAFPFSGLFRLPTPGELHNPGSWIKEQTVKYSELETGVQKNRTGPETSPGILTGVKQGDGRSVIHLLSVKLISWTWSKSQSD